MDLVSTISKICYYAQSHSADKEAWGPRESTDLRYSMEHVSFVVACFLAQNTTLGNHGVSFDIVLKDLIGKVKTEKQWTSFFKKMVKDFGGETHGSL